MPPPPVWHSVGVLFLYGALDGHPLFPSHVALGRCVLSAAAAGAPAGVVSAFAEPSGWCAGAVLNVAGCAVCVSAAPSSWRIGGCAGCCGGRLTVFAVPTRLCPQAVHHLPLCVSVCGRPMCPAPHGDPGDVRCTVTAPASSVLPTPGFVGGSFSCLAPHRGPQGVGHASPGGRGGGGSKAASTPAQNTGQRNAGQAGARASGQAARTSAGSSAMAVPPAAGIQPLGCCSQSPRRPTGVNTSPCCTVCTTLA